MTTLKLGLHENVPFDQYLKWPYLSQSVIKHGRKSMAHLKAAYDDETKSDPTDSMTLGSALHAAFLEPELMPDRVVKWTGGTRRGAEWDAFKTDNSSRIILTQVMHDKLMGMIRSLRRHPYVKQWLSRIEAVEVSAVGEIDGMIVKGRIDALTDEPLVDLKMWGNMAERRVQSQIYDMGYDIQAAIYTELVKRDRFIFLFVEPEPPFDVMPVEIDADYMRHARHDVAEILHDWQQCCATGEFPGQASEPISCGVPPWIAESDGYDKFIKKHSTKGVPSWA